MSINKRLIVIVVAIAGAVFFVQGGLSRFNANISSSPTSDSSKEIPAGNIDISNWKEYKSQNGDYKVNYPQDWTEESSEGRFSVLSKDNISVSIYMEKATDQDNFEKFYSQANGALEPDIIKLQNIQVGGHSALMLQKTLKADSGESSSLVYQIKGENKSYYFISFTPFTNESWDKNSSVINNMVSSFKFLSSTTASPAP